MSAEERLSACVLIALPLLLGGWLFHRLGVPGLLVVGAGALFAVGAPWMRVAIRIPVKILSPQIFCLFPALLVVILAPGAFTAVRVLAGG